MATASLEPSRDVQARDGDILVPVSLVNLNEDGVAPLEEALTPPPEPPAERPTDWKAMRRGDRPSPGGGEGGVAETQDT